jgi:tagatose-1,6-bisphosphate aldolase
MTLGKLRGMQQLANDRHVFTITAFDHRQSFKRMITPLLSHEPSWAEVVAEKKRLVAALAPHSSAVLLDPLYGAGPLLAAGLIPGATGVLVAREASGYSDTAQGRVTALQPGWSASAIKRLGASAVKLLIYYHPEAPVAQQQEEVVLRVAKACRDSDIALVLEIVTYAIPEFTREKSQLVLESARRLASQNIDLLKVEFPADFDGEIDEVTAKASCHELSTSIPVPWVLLSAAVDFPIFQKQVEIACEAGASGFLAGRAIWKEAMSLPNVGEREHFLSTVAVSRLCILNDIANYRARPWLEACQKTVPTLSEGWYETYQEAV